VFKRKKETFKFTGRSHSIRGIISVILGCISFIAFIIISVISSLSGGNGGLILGVIGIALFILSCFGFVLGIKGCKEKEIYYTAPLTGLVLNGFLSVIYFLLYMAGFIIY
jgi:hypothetical protein